MDLHRRRSVLVRMTEDGKRLGTARIGIAGGNLSAAARAVPPILHAVSLADVGR